MNKKPRLNLDKDENNKAISLREEIQIGIDSGIAKDFEPAKFLELLKARKI